MIEYPAYGRIVFHCFHISAHCIIGYDEQLGETVDIIAWGICLYRLFAEIIRVSTRFLCHHTDFVRFTIMHFGGGFHQCQYFRLERVECDRFCSFIIYFDPFGQDGSPII